MRMLQQPELLERLQWYPMGSSVLALEVFHHCHALVFFFPDWVRYLRRQEWLCFAEMLEVWARGYSVSCYVEGQVKDVSSYSSLCLWRLVSWLKNNVRLLCYFLTENCLRGKNGSYALILAATNGSYSLLLSFPLYFRKLTMGSLCQIWEKA